MKTLTKVLGAVVVAAALSLTGCASTHVAHPVSHAKATTAPKAAAPKPAGPDGTAAHPYPQGTVTVTDTGSQWDVTLTALNSNATAPVQAQDPYTTLTPGSQYVFGHLTVTVNKKLTAENTGKSVAVWTSLEPVYVGGDGKIYDSSSDIDSSASLTHDWISQPDIINNVGVKTEGDFAFAVPTSAIAGGHFGVQNYVTQKIVYFG